MKMHRVITQISSGELKYIRNYLFHKTPKINLNVFRSFYLNLHMMAL